MCIHFNVIELCDTIMESVGRQKRLGFCEKYSILAGLMFEPTSSFQNFTLKKLAQIEVYYMAKTIRTYRFPHL